MKMYFTKTHEWVKIDGDKAYIGISAFATKELGDIVYVGLPEVGDKITAGNSFAEVESVKTVAEILAPVSGTVSEINSELYDAPELLNENPLTCYICCVEDFTEPSGLMNDVEYAEFLK